MSTLKVDTLQTTGGAGLYPAKAWINQTNGTTINASANISSLVDNNVGRYTANLSNALTSINFVCFGTRMYGSVNEDRQGIACGAVTTSSFQHGGGHNQGNGGFEDGTYSAGLLE
tara:strand:+ start:985 stop:1329 length:345 start_codon:yes stop_codon:yes gene_type:complete